MLIIVLGLSQSMRTCVDQIMSLPHIAGPRIRKESDISRTIGNIATQRHNQQRGLLDAGAIQGAFELLGTLVEMGVSQKEIIQELRNTLDRAKRLEEKHPGLDFAVESGRAS